MRLVIHLTEDFSRPYWFYRRLGGRAAYLEFSGRFAEKAGERVALTPGEASQMWLKLLEDADAAVINAVPAGDEDYVGAAGRFALMCHGRVAEVHVFTPVLEGLPKTLTQVGEVAEEWHLGEGEARELAEELGLSEWRALVGLTVTEARAVARRAGEGADPRRAASELKARRLSALGLSRVEDTELTIFTDVARRLRPMVEAGGFRILLTGLTGGGKTWMARHLARYHAAPGYEVSGQSLAARESSGSTRIRELLRGLERAKPIYLVLNEFEAVARDEALYAMLEWLESEGSRGVDLAATTVALDEIDPQLIRPGRVDAVALIPLPNMAERVRLASQTAAKLGLSDHERGKVVATASRMAGATPAEITGMVERRGEHIWDAEKAEARMRAYRELEEKVSSLPNGIVFRKSRKGVFSLGLPRL